MHPRQLGCQLRHLQAERLQVVPTWDAQHLSVHSGMGPWCPPALKMPLIVIAKSIMKLIL
jgi:hypothetical protein